MHDRLRKIEARVPSDPPNVKVVYRTIEDGLFVQDERGQKTCTFSDEDEINETYPDADMILICQFGADSEYA